MKKVIHSPFFWPVLVLLVIAGQAGALVVFGSGTMPFKVRNIGLESADGTRRTQFAPGEIVGIRREVCADRDIAIEFYPALRSANHGLISLANGATFMRKECRQTVNLFTLPANLPLGSYQFENVVKYQSNLIGRDEQTIYPPLELEVVDAR
jgi:hypothetical protein